MSEEKKTKDWFQLISDKGLYVIFCIFIIYILLLVIITWPISEYSVSKTGVFGDSFGVLTALFSALAFWGVCVSISIQQKELKSALLLFKDQQVFNRKQQFEATLFSMIKILNEKVQSTKHHSSRPDKEGGTIETTRVGAQAFYECIQTIYSHYPLSGLDRARTESIKGNIINLNKALDSTKFLYGTNFNYYPRYIKSVLDFIDKNITDITEARSYAKIFAATLSDPELFYIFYFCFTKKGKKLRKLVAKLNFLYELPDTYIVPEHKKLRELITYTQ